MHVIFDTPGGVGLYFSYNIFAWLIVAVLIALGLWQVTLNKRIYYSNMLLWLSVGCLLLIIPAFYHYEFTDHAIPRLLALVAGLLFLFCLYQFKLGKNEARQLLLLILLAVIIEALFGLVQFFLLKPGDWGGYVVGSSRPHGVFLQPNVMASFMATGLAIALFLSTSKQIKINQTLVKTLVLLGLFVTSFLLVLLQSRTGFVAAIAVGLLLLPYIYQQNKTQLATNGLIIALSISLAIICLQSSDTPIRGEQVYQQVGARSAQFIVSLDMIKQEPIMGYGYGGFERSFIDHFNRYAQDNPDIGNTLTRLSHPHNELLLWVVEGGIVALLAFVLFTIAYLNTWRKLPMIKGLALLALILPILLHSQLEFPFYSSVSHWLVFLIMLWLLDSFALVNNSTHRSIACDKTFFIRFFALLIPSIFVPFLLTSLHTANILVEYEKDPTDSEKFRQLSKLINPIAWQSRLDAAVYAHIFIQGLRDNDEEQLQTYLAWALKRIRHKPRVVLYKNCLQVLKALAKEQAYQSLLAEAKRTYPQEKHWRETILEKEQHLKTKLDE
jgi:O-antigen polymerase